MIIVLLFGDFFHTSVSRGFLTGVWVTARLIQVSKTLLSILADFNNTIVWIISSRLLIFKSSSPCISPLLIVPRALITISITVTFMFQSFFSSLARFRYLSHFSLPFNFILWSAGTSKSTIWQVLFFCCCCWLSLGLVLWSRLDNPAVSQNPSEVCTSHSSGQMLSCAYTICSYFNFLHNSQWITLPHQSRLVLYSFCASLLHSLIMFYHFVSITT